MLFWVLPSFFVLIEVEKPSFSRIFREMGLSNYQDNCPFIPSSFSCVS
jgi:hypothetical protein